MKGGTPTNILSLVQKQHISLEYLNRMFKSHGQVTWLKLGSQLWSFALCVFECVTCHVSQHLMSSVSPLRRLHSSEI